MLIIMKIIILGAAFLLELVAFISFACVGFVLPLSHGLQIVASILLFVALMAFWSIYMAPKAPKKFGPLAYYLAKLGVYAVSAYVLYHAHYPKGSALFIVAVMTDEIFLFRHNLSRSTEHDS